jgi:citrate lyase subunit beta/citryl-CoA lyase
MPAVAKAVDEARVLGFDGATCIHPSVVPILNEGFSPPPAEVERACRILAAFEQAQKRGEGVSNSKAKWLTSRWPNERRRLLARRHGV